MKLSHTMGMTAGAALLAVTGFASAADVAAKNTYATNGLVVAVSDGAGGAICKAFGQVVGEPSVSTVFYPGAGLPGMVLVSPGTSPTATTAGSTVTSVCTTNSTVAAAGLDGSTIVFNCFENSQTQKKVPTAAAATISATFAASAASVPTVGQAVNVETVATLTVPGAGTCNFTSDATWTAE